MRRTAIAIGCLAGLLCLVWNLVWQRDLLVAAWRSLTVTLVVATVAAIAFRAMARVLIAQMRQPPDPPDVAASGHHPPLRR